MVEQTQLCTICQLELACKVCYCCKELKLIGQSCLMSHLTQNATSHFLINILVSSELQIKAIFSDPTRYEAPKTFESSNYKGISIQSITQLSYSSQYLIQDIKFSSIFKYHLNQAASNCNKSSNTSNYIYYCQDHTKHLIRYDILNKTLSKILLSDIDYPFIKATAYEIPGGDVVISGFDDSSSEVVYLYRPYRRSCIKVHNFLHHKFEFKFHYHDNFMYVFGTFYPDNGIIYTTERYLDTLNRWQRLPNMRRGGGAISPISLGD